jgi:hypothetical protein
MRRRSSLLLVVAATIFGAMACEQSHLPTMITPSPSPIRSAVPDAAYRLGASERARIISGFDPEALERLLARITPSRRAEVLRYFQVREDRSVRLGMLVSLADAELQPLLEEVWAPMWDEVGATDEQIAQNTYAYPGREIALARRAARKHEGDLPR